MTGREPFQPIKCSDLGISHCSPLCGGALSTYSKHGGAERSISDAGEGSACIAKPIQTADRNTNKLNGTLKTL
jgi:hypothetical protein